MLRLRRGIWVAVVSAGLGMGAAGLLPQPLFSESGDEDCMKKARCGGLNCYKPSVVDCTKQEVGGCSITVCLDSPE
jgi:hypothetical protein